MARHNLRPFSLTPLFIKPYTRECLVKYNSWFDSRVRLYHPELNLSIIRGKGQTPLKVPNNHWFNPDISFLKQDHYYYKGIVDNKTLLEQVPDILVLTRSESIGEYKIDDCYLLYLGRVMDERVLFSYVKSISMKRLLAIY